MVGGTAGFVMPGCAAVAAATAAVVSGVAPTQNTWQNLNQGCLRTETDISRIPPLTKICIH